MSWSERFGSRLAGQRGSVGETATAGRSGGRATASGLASAVNGVRPLRSRMLDYDHSLLWVVIALLGLGIVMVYSASIAMPDSPKYASYRDYAFLVRQIVFVVMGSVIGVIAFRIPISTWDKYAPKLFLLALLTLVIVLIPHVG